MTNAAQYHLAAAVARQAQWIRATYDRLYKHIQRVPTESKGDEEIMANPTMTHDEIKSALALKYGNAQAVCERIHGEAWQALTEERDADRYEFLMNVVGNVTHHLEGIQTAAEALGISKDELAEAARIAGTEGRLA